ncbi:MAG: CRISPR-associated helicase Cas3' [Oscillatoriales cyanobacterium SM2_2_1]|nr:CRISPR-associated helicase Cas3' [Oscillatoriales cyanobacterium SM2_2_1]
MANLPEKLLAKSTKGDRTITLQEHLFDTAKSARQIFRLDGRWGQNWCRFFRLASEAEQQKFLMNLRVAALFHDIGKANEEFYRAVSGGCEQTFRHEHISALILHLPQVRAWLNHQPLDVEVITAAVLCHHLKAAEKGDHQWGSPRKGTRNKPVQLYLLHTEVRNTLKEIAEIANLDQPPNLNISSFSQNSQWEQAWNEGMKTARNLMREISDSRRNLLLAVKAGLIAADAVASGIVREEDRIRKTIDEWINEVVHSSQVTETEVFDSIITPILGKIKARQENKEFDLRNFREKYSKEQILILQTQLLHNFQKLAAQQGSRVLLLAACGAGKTLAAWKWAEEQVKHYKVGKVIFLYPTRGTATEGFKDYVSWAPEADAALVTGTARYELEAMADNPPDSMKEKDFTTDDRLFSLGFWSRRYFSATVDQFLGFMEHSYGGICLLPALADSVLIIDEIHSFDRKMFDSLIAFLKHFDIPVLCMTATLPPSRRKQLMDLRLQVYPTESDRKSLEDLEEKENHPRYQILPVTGFDEAFTKAIDAYRKNERVLWVVNTVDRCLAISKRLADELKVEVLTYHSRFRLCDRQKVHADTVKAFAFQKDGERQSAIAVTTQVCEMSLDLDTDVLITEFAPISSLVQRFGRANRHLARGEDFRAALHIYKPPKEKPYKPEEVKKVQEFLDELGQGGISQKQLSEALEKFANEERKSDGSNRFLDSGYFATMGSFRDTEEYAMPCILDRDLDEVKRRIESKPKKETYDGFIINVPHQGVKVKRFDDTKPSWLPKYLGIAQWESNYDVRSGFSTKNLEEVEL